MNPILATQGAPGMGKSTFLDALAFMGYDVVRRLSPPEATEEFCRAIESSIRVSIDYNGYQTPTDFDIKSPVAGLALRMLHSCVVAHLWCAFCSVI